MSNLKKSTQHKKKHISHILNNTCKLKKALNIHTSFEIAVHLPFRNTIHILKYSNEIIFNRGKWGFLLS